MGTPFFSTRLKNSESARPMKLEARSVKAQFGKNAVMSAANPTTRLPVTALFLSMTLSAKPPLPSPVPGNRFFKITFREVRPQFPDKVEFGIRQLPQQKIRYPVLPGRPYQKVRVGEAFRV